MMSENEVREVRDALTWARRQPCECAGTEHEFKCVQGGMLMKSAIDAFSTVLGEMPDGPNMKMLAVYRERN